MKKLIALLLSIGVTATCAVGFSSCGGDTLKIGYTDYAPMNYYEGNEFVGFDTEFANKVCRELGYKAEFIEINWNNKVISLNSGEIDCIWNGMTITEELSENILISDSYLENRQVVVCRTADASRFTDVASLSGATSVTYEQGSAADGLVSDSYSGTFRAVTKTAQEAQSSTLLEVKTGRSDVAIIDITMAKSMTGAGTNYTDLTYVDVGFPVEYYGIGFRKADTELCGKVNELIATYKTNGFFTELYNKYMA